MAKVASPFGALILILLATVVAGCTGEKERLLAESDLPRLALQPSDLSQQWIRFDEGRQLRADAPLGERGDATRFDRLDGWKARYRRPGSPETEGPLVIESRADLFAAVSGAEQDFDVAIADLERSGTAGGLGDLGDEARVRNIAGEPGQLATVTIIWREQNVLATLTANGFGGRLEEDDVVALAHKQQQRIERARG